MKIPRREPARWRWTSNAKTRRELWRGMDMLAYVEQKGGPGFKWTWRAFGSERWGRSDDLGRCEVEAKAEAVRVEEAGR